MNDNYISEFAGFTGIICKYYIAIGDREAAELLFKNLKQIAPKHPKRKMLKRFCIRHLSDGYLENEFERYPSYGEFENQNI